MHLAALKCVVALYEHDPGLDISTVCLMKEVADEALKLSEIESVFALVIGNLRDRYGQAVDPDKTRLRLATKVRQDAIEVETHYRNTRSAHDLHSAIALATNALDLSPDGFMKAISRELLGRCLFERYMIDGNLADIDDAVGLLLESNDGLSEDEFLIPTNLANLGYILTIRYERTRTPADLDVGIDAIALTVDRATGPHGRQVFWWANLANALRLRSKSLRGDSSDLQEAQRLYNETLAATPASWPEHGAFKANLANIEFDLAMAENDLTPAALEQHVGRLRDAATYAKDLPFP